MPENIDERRSNEAYINILNWFADFPGKDHIYSIHNMIQCGMKYDKLPGEWYGPSAAALVLRDITKLHHASYGGQLEVYVCNSDTIYISEVNELCTANIAANNNGLDNGNDSLQAAMHSVIEVDDLATATKIVSETECADTESGDSFFDPLLRPPPSLERPWNCGLMVIIPLKLGLDTVTDVYKEATKKALEHPHSVGIIGGRVNHAIYFVGHTDKSGGTGIIHSSGSSNSQLIGLDPHVVYSSSHFESKPFPSPALSAQVHPSLYANEFVFTTGESGTQTSAVNADSNAQHSSTANTNVAGAPVTYMSIDQLDPSIGLGFYFRNKEEFNDFCTETRSKQTTQSQTSVPPSNSKVIEPVNLYNVEYAPPTYDFSAFDDGDDDVMCAGDRNDGDDEYVFL